MKKETQSDKMARFSWWYCGGEVMTLLEGVLRRGSDDTIGGGVAEGK